MAKGHIERLCDHAGILRVGGALGEPWTWACVLHYQSPESVIVKAVSVAPSLREGRDAIEIAKASGIVNFRFYRHRDNHVEMHEGTTKQETEPCQTNSD